MKSRLIETIHNLIRPRKIFIVRRDGVTRWNGKVLDDKALEDLTQKYTATIINVKYKQTGRHE